MSVHLLFFLCTIEHDLLLSFILQILLYNLLFCIQHLYWGRSVTGESDVLSLAYLSDLRISLEVALWLKLRGILFFSRLYWPVCQKHTQYKRLELHNCLGKPPAACTIVNQEEVVFILISPPKDTDKSNTNSFTMCWYTSQLLYIKTREGKGFGTEYTFLVDIILLSQRLSEWFHNKWNYTAYPTDIAVEGTKPSAISLCSRGLYGQSPVKLLCISPWAFAFLWKELVLLTFAKSD